MKYLRLLYVQVIIGIALGILVGIAWPVLGQALKPLGDAFIKAIKLVIAPLIFCTVGAGIAHMGDVKKFGRVGGKALLYFEVVSSFALMTGLAMGSLLKPGRGFHIDPATLDPSVAAGFAVKATHEGSAVDYFLSIIPDTFVGAFTGGDLMQVLFLAVLIGFACSRLGDFGKSVANGLDKGARIFFSIIHIVVRAAPLAAFGAMAFTIGRYGIGSLVQLGSLVAVFYLTSIVFVVVVLGTIARIVGFSLFRLLAYIREELLIVLGASSSEAVLPQIMEKLERLGAAKSVVGLVIPTGYSFNPDGTSIYMTLAILFLAQATGINLSIEQISTLLVVSMLTSKGASGVTGAGFIGLAATLTVVPDIPIQSLALLVGVDRFMSECRALTNLIGNGVATLAIARWEGDLDMEQLRHELARGPAGIDSERIVDPSRASA